MASFIFCFFFVLLLEPIFIKRLKELGVKGQPIRDDGPKDHAVKQGTPTMGGLVIVAGVLLSTLLFGDLANGHVWLTLAVMIGYAALGFMDDWRKVTKQNSKGLSERQKLMWQFGIAGGAAILLLVAGFSTTLQFPFIKHWSFELGIILFIIFSMLVVVGTSNAVNLTDGLDGLAIVPVMTVALTYAVFAYVAGHNKFSGYLEFFYWPDAGELTIILTAIAAGGLGFLWYNTFPAQVFMGDVGALALGGTLGFIAVLVKQEIILVLAGGIFVVEALSVIIQRYYYKMTGKRVFRMAPIHHHFELSGWPEPKIIVRFWIVSIVLALLTLTSLKLR